MKLFRVKVELLSHSCTPGQEILSQPVRRGDYRPRDPGGGRNGPHLPRQHHGDAAPHYNLTVVRLDRPMRNTQRLPLQDMGFGSAEFNVTRSPKMRAGNIWECSRAR